MAHRAVFLDRDGVLNRLVWRRDEEIWDSPYRLDEFELLPGVPEAVRAIRALGFLVVVVSNQPGAAKGKCGRMQLDLLFGELRRQLRFGGADVDAIYYCPHHPDAVVECLRFACNCRKPKPGLLHIAASDLDIDLGASYLVGDSDKDIAAALAAGCWPILVGREAGVARAASAARAPVSAGLVGAASLARGVGGVPQDSFLSSPMRATDLQEATQLIARREQT